MRIPFAALPVGIRFGPSCVLHEFATIRTIAQPELLEDGVFYVTGEPKLCCPFAIPPAKWLPTRKIILRGRKIEIVVTTFALGERKQDLLLQWGGVGDTESETEFPGFLSDKGNP